MKCPYCVVEVNESWDFMYNTTRDFRGDPNSYLEDKVGSKNIQGFDTPIKAHFSFLWMRCPNKSCDRLIVKGLVTRQTAHGGIPQETKIAEWIIWPRWTIRYINPLVSDQYAEDYRQAAAILEASPKASAALSRRVLADLLKDYGGYDNSNLSVRITDFINDKSNPSTLRENLHHLREMGNFGAHTQKDELTGVVIDVEPEEAEWCLEVLDGLFDYYIVGPKRDAERRASFNEKLARANRKPINPSE
jgi:hypothetical protein